MNDYSPLFMRQATRLFAKLCWVNILSRPIFRSSRESRKIGEEWIYYAGVAKSLQERESYLSRDWYIRQIAVLLAGEAAERLVTEGGRFGGKSQ